MPYDFRLNSPEEGGEPTEQEIKLAKEFADIFEDIKNELVDHAADCHIFVESVKKVTLNPPKSAEEHKEQIYHNWSAMNDSGLELAKKVSKIRWANRGK